MGSYECASSTGNSEAIHYAKLPPLVVTDKKLGPDHRGAVGFWIETGPMGYFSNLKISPMAVRKISCANPF
jgi:hypothetical protein